MQPKDLKSLYIAYEQAKSLRELIGKHSTAGLTYEQKLAFDADLQEAFNREYEAYCAYRSAEQEEAMPTSNPYIAEALFQAMRPLTKEQARWLTRDPYQNPRTYADRGQPLDTEPCGICGDVHAAVPLACETGDGE